MVVATTAEPEPYEQPDVFSQGFHILSAPILLRAGRNGKLNLPLKRTVRTGAEDHSVFLFFYKAAGLGNMLFTNTVTHVPLGDLDKIVGGRGSWRRCPKGEASRSLRKTMGDNNLLSSGS